MSESNEALLLRDIEEVWNQGNLDAIDEIFAVDVILYEASSGAPSGAKGLKQVIAPSKSPLGCFSLPKVALPKFN